MTTERIRQPGKSSLKARAALLLAVGFLVALGGCGYQGRRSGFGANFDGEDSGGYSGGGTGTGTRTQSSGTSQSQYSTNTSGIPSGNQTQCSGLSTSQKFIEYCANTMGKYADELTDACAYALQGVYNQTCSGLPQRIQKAMNACASDFNAMRGEYRSYVEPACAQYLDSLMGR